MLKSLDLFCLEYLLCGLLYGENEGIHINHQNLSVEDDLLSKHLEDKSQKASGPSGIYLRHSDSIDPLVLPSKYTGLKRHES